MKTLNSIINEKLIINKKIKQQGQETNYLLIDWHNLRSSFGTQVSNQDMNLFRSDMENDNVYMGAFIHKRSSDCRCTLYDNSPRLFEMKLNSKNTIIEKIEKANIINDIIKVYSYSLMFKKSISFGLQIDDKKNYFIVIISSTKEEYQEIYNIMIQDKWKLCDNLDQIYSCLK